jgi:hypothetical protein
MRVNPDLFIDLAHLKNIVAEYAAKIRDDKSYEEQLTGLMGRVVAGSKM